MNIPSVAIPQTVLHIYAAKSGENSSPYGGICAITIRCTAEGEIVKKAKRAACYQAETLSRLEMISIINGLEALGACTDEPIIVFTAMEMIPKAMTEWLAKWKAASWKNAKRGLIANRDLWEALEAAAKGRVIEWRIAKEAVFPDLYSEAVDAALEARKERMVRGS